MWTYILNDHWLHGIDLEGTCDPVSLELSYGELAMLVPAHSLKSMKPFEAASNLAAPAIDILS